MGIFTNFMPFPSCFGDQPQAIKQLVADRPGISTLLGVTGSGKTYHHCPNNSTAIKAGAYLVPQQDVGCTAV